MSKEELKSFLVENNLLLVDKNQFHDFMISVNQKTKTDKRLKWIDRKTLQDKYNVSRRWILNNEPYLDVRQDGGLTSKKMYREESVKKLLE